MPVITILPFLSLVKILPGRVKPTLFSDVTKNSNSSSVSALPVRFFFAFNCNSTSVNFLQVFLKLTVVSFPSVTSAEAVVASSVFFPVTVTSDFHRYPSSPAVFSITVQVPSGRFSSVTLPPSFRRITAPASCFPDALYWFPAVSVTVNSYSLFALKPSGASTLFFTVSFPSFTWFSKFASFPVFNGSTQTPSVFVTGFPSTLTCSISNVFSPAFTFTITAYSLSSYAIPSSFVCSLTVRWQVPALVNPISLNTMFPCSSFTAASGRLIPSFSFAVTPNLNSPASRSLPARLLVAFSAILIPSNALQMFLKLTVVSFLSVTSAEAVVASSVFFPVTVTSDFHRYPSSPAVFSITVQVPSGRFSSVTLPPSFRRITAPASCFPDALYWFPAVSVTVNSYSLFALKPSGASTLFFTVSFPVFTFSFSTLIVLFGV